MMLLKSLFDVGQKVKQKIPDISVRDGHYSTQQAQK